MTAETKKINNTEAGLMLDIRTNKECPRCKVGLKSAILHNVGIDYCPKCFGLWFDEDELQWAKDKKDKNLKWLDIDLWGNEEKFKVAYGIRVCPTCRVPLYEVYYGDSRVVVDACRICHGTWLDRAEFRKIIDWLHEKAGYEIIHNYAKNLALEFSEIFIGPESFREEIADFLTLLKLLSYKFAVQRPLITQMMAQMPK